MEVITRSISPKGVYGGDIERARWELRPGDRLLLLTGFSAFADTDALGHEAARGSIEQALARVLDAARGERHAEATAAVVLEIGAEPG